MPKEIHISFQRAWKRVTDLRNRFPRRKSSLIGKSFVPHGERRSAQSPNQRATVSTMLAYRWLAALWSHRPGHSESNRIELNLVVPLEPDRRADKFRLVMPGPSSNDAKARIRALQPCRAISRRIFVTVVPNIFHPLP